MPATIGEILKTKPELVTTTPDTSLYVVLEDLIRYDYSQLPVIDVHGKPVGMITSDSIVRALNHFNVTVREPEKAELRQQQLRVMDAMLRQIATCGPEDDVFAVLKHLRDVSGVLVLDSEGKLIGIVTSYDTTEYLRQRVQDIVLVQDIEEMIKDYVRLAFKRSDGSEDQAALDAAIAKITSSTDALKVFKKAILAYLQATGVQPKIDPHHAQAIFDDYLARKPEPFDKLVLSEYIQLLLHEDRWPLYRPVLQAERDAIGRMLGSVRSTRNDLSHLRIDITARQRDELRFCRDWLRQYYDELKVTLTPTLPTIDQIAAQTEHNSLPSVELEQPLESASITVMDEVPMPGASRYAPLADWLYGYPADQDRISLSFAHIERIIGGKLPDSARDNRSWWSNDSVGHVQSRLWLGAGWRVDEVDLAREAVTFVRMKGRERAYINFYNALFADLQPLAPFPLLAPTRTGYFWQSVTRMPSPGPHIGYLTCAFTRARGPRVELYIDTGDQVRNKHIFDALRMRQETIEMVFGGSLEWERMDSKRSSRIALYYPDNITVEADSEELTKVRTWAVDALVRLHRALEPHVQASLSDGIATIAHNGSAVAQPDA